MKYVKGIIIILALLLLFFTLYQRANYYNDHSITFYDVFEDDAVAIRVAQTLKKEPKQVVETCDIDSLVSLDLSHTNFESLAGIEIFYNIQSLNISNNNLNILPNINLKNLKTLNFSNNKIYTISEENKLYLSTLNNIVGEQIDLHLNGGVFTVDDKVVIRAPMLLSSGENVKAKILNENDEYSYFDIIVSDNYYYVPAELVNKVGDYRVEVLVQIYDNIEVNVITRVSIEEAI